MSEAHVVRVSWVMYLSPLFSIGIGLTLIAAYLYFYTNVVSFVEEAFATWTSGAQTVVSLIPIGILVLAVARVVWQLALLRSVTVSITPQGVSYKKGILPWEKTQMFWYPDQIYSAMYSEAGKFVGWLFRFGTLTIIGKEGSTREYKISGLHNPRRAQLLIARLRQAK